MQEINLYDLIKHYLKYWPLIVVASVLGLVGGMIYNAVQAPMYKSSSTLILIDPSKATTSSAANSGIINNYLELMKSRRVLEPVIIDLKLPLTYDQLVSAVSTSNEKGTDVVKLSISTDDPATSKRVVDGTVTSFKEEVKRLYDIDSIKVVDSASTPSTPYNVHTYLQLGLATLAGFLISLIVVFFIYDFNLNKPVVSKTATSKKSPSARKNKSKQAAQRTRKQ